MERFENLVRANQMLLADWPEEKVDVLYVFELSKGMVKSGKIFDVAIDEIYSKGLAGHIAFNSSKGERYGGHVPGEGWPGCQWYVDNLTERYNQIYDRSSENLVGKIFFLTKFACHTKQETDALIELMKEKKWLSVGLLTVAYHYPRAFMCLIKSMNTLGYPVRAYAMSPKTTNWWQPMKGSQGIEDTIPFNECIKDNRKVLEYIEKGFSCNFDELFHYLFNRMKPLH